MNNFKLTVVTFAVSLFAFANGQANGASDCTFTTIGSTMYLDADCTTDETILVPDGLTLDGGGHAITAVDPDPGTASFLGPIVTNAGSTAYVTRLVVQGSGLAHPCHSGANRLRGIMFEGASGAILQNTIQAINRGASGCQEGNAIEVRNAPFDGTHPNTHTVLIEHNVVENYQKTGIVCNGDVVCNIRLNFVGESATQENLAANSIQFGFGATGTLELNHIAGNQWLGASNFAATAVLVYLADAMTIQRNNIGGNADVGVYLFGESGLLDNNRIFDGGPDGPHGDFGLYDFGSTNVVTNNKIRGFVEPSNVDGQVIISGGPADPHPVCFGTDSDCGLAATP